MTKKEFLSIMNRLPKGRYYEGREMDDWFEKYSKWKKRVNEDAFFEELTEFCEYFYEYVVNRGFNVGCLNMFNRGKFHYVDGDGDHPGYLEVK